MDDKIFKQDAKQMVDMMFDSNLFHDNVTRDNMNTFQDLIQFLLQSKFDSYKRLEKLNESVKKIK